MRAKTMEPVHPGEILVEEFLTPLSVSQYRLAKDISVSARRINEIVHGTGDNGGHGAQALPLFRSFRPFLAKPPVAIRP